MDDEVWLRVGEVARRTGLSVRTLHHWDERGLLVPSGRSSGDYRLYSAGDVERLLRIQHLKSLGLSLDEVAAALDSADFDAAEALERHIDAVEERIAAEQELLRRLTRLRSAADAGWEEVLEVAALSERLRHPDAAVRFRASLEASSSAPVAELVERLATDPAEGVREGLTWALVHHGSEATDAVVARLADPDPAVRFQFAHVLGKLGDVTAVSDLAPLLHDEEPRVAAKAAQSLGALGGADAVAALVAALARTAAPDPVVTALGAVGAAAVHPLLAALREGDATLRARAAEALGFIGAEDAASALVLALTDSSALVRYEALVALGQTPGPVAEAAIESLVDAEDPRLRTVASRLSRDRLRA
ncbi:MerR family transcriptional regulator [Tessaracoccus terricola]